MGSHFTKSLDLGVIRQYGKDHTELDGDFASVVTIAASLQVREFFPEPNNPFDGTPVIPAFYLSWRLWHSFDGIRWDEVPDTNGNFGHMLPRLGVTEVTKSAPASYAVPLAPRLAITVKMESYKGGRLSEARATDAVFHYHARCL